MEILQDAVLEMLRSGHSVTSVKEKLMTVVNELQAMEVYLKAIKEAGLRP
jgi:urease gamma subunit